LESVIEHEPRLDRSTQVLLEEHAQLLHSLNALIEEAESKIKLSDAFRKKVRSWVKDFRQHETRENALVGDAYNLDIGAED